MPSPIRRRRRRRRTTATATTTTYHTFISYLRGHRRSWEFAHRLKDEMKSEGLSAFLDDDDIRLGYSVEETTKKALYTSRLFVPVISKGYASSPQVLKELEKILEIGDIYGRFVYPIFLDNIAKTSDLEDELGIFVDVRRSDGTEDELNRWRRVLNITFGRRGMVLKDRKEAEFIRDIVKNVKDELNRTDMVGRS